MSTLSPRLTANCGFRTAVAHQSDLCPSAHRAEFYVIVWLNGCVSSFVGRRTGSIGRDMPRLPPPVPGDLGSPKAPSRAYQGVKGVLILLAVLAGAVVLYVVVIMTGL